MHAGGAGRVRLVERRDTVRHDRIGGQRRQTRTSQQHAEVGARFVDVHARLGIERGRRDVGEPVHEPRLTKVVVDDEQTVRGEPFADGAERLLGEHVALEPHAGEARLHGQRVDEREDDQVVLLVGRPQVVSCVVVDPRHPRIGVRPIRMVGEAQPHDHGIDLDGVHVRRAVLQRGRDVGAGPGAEDEHVLERVAEDRVGPLVEVLLVIDRRHRLVKDVVHLDDRVGAFLADGDLVVGRPDGAARHRVHEHERRGEKQQIDRHAREPRLLRCSRDPAIAGAEAPRRTPARTRSTATARATT